MAVVELNAPPADDSDLEDLLSSKNDQSLKGAIDKLAYNESNKSRISIIDFFCAYMSLLVMEKPKLACCLVASSLLSLFLLVNLTLKNGTNVPLESVISTDYSSIQSKYDLSLGKIDHWCLQGGDKNCRCEDPLHPSGKTAYRNWNQAFEMNKDQIDDSIDRWGEDEVDVVFLGENIVELWAGRSVSFTSTFSTDIGSKFSKLFNKEKGGDFNGIPLGIAGDTTQNVLWRIQNGEIPDNLNPKVWWIVLGTNDLAMRQCSEEIVLLGILRVIEEILEVRPEAKIVVNSILPLTSDKKGRVPKISSYQSLQKFHQHRTASKNHRRASIVRTRMKSSSGFLSIRMWPSVVAVNAALKKFCEKHMHVTFFDSYDIFVDETNPIPEIRSYLMKSVTLGQPSESGHDKLLKEISQKINYIFTKHEGSSVGKIEKKYLNKRVDKKEKKNDSNKIKNKVEGGKKIVKKKESSRKEINEDVTDEGSGVEKKEKKNDSNKIKNKVGGKGSVEKRKKIVSNKKVDSTKKKGEDDKEDLKKKGNNVDDTKEVKEKKKKDEVKKGKKGKDSAEKNED